MPNEKFSLLLYQFEKQKELDLFPFFFFFFFCPSNQLIILLKLKIDSKSISDSLFYLRAQKKKKVDAMRPKKFFIENMLTFFFSFPKELKLHQ